MEMYEYLDQLLKERGMTHYRLAEMTGIKTNAFSSLKKRPNSFLSFVNMTKVADVLDISLDEFRKFVPNSRYSQE